MLLKLLLLLQSTNNHSLSFFVASKLTLKLKTKSVWRHSAAVSSPKKDANAAPTAANAVWTVARHSSRLPNLTLYTHHNYTPHFPKTMFKPKLNKAGQERERDRQRRALVSASSHCWVLGNRGRRRDIREMIGEN